MLFGCEGRTKEPRERALSFYVRFFGVGGGGVVGGGVVGGGGGGVTQEGWSSAPHSCSRVAGCGTPGHGPEPRRSG